jgi:DNA-binding response OmpR family regulator
VRRNILVVEDDDALCNTIQILLNEEGFVTDTAFDGHEALKKALKASGPLLVILDIMLPRFDGFQFISEVRKQNLQHITVLAMTALNKVNLKNVLYKPFKAESLLAAVHKALSLP